MHLDRRLLGWGIFFILLGAVPLAIKAGLVDEAVVAQWPLLWPVLLIGWGLGLLLRETRLAVIGGAVSAITFGLMGGGALATGFGGIPFAAGCTSDAAAAPFVANSGELGEAATVDIEFSCGSLVVRSAVGSGWALDGSDRDGLGPTTGASHDLLSISPHRGHGPFDTSGRATWNVSLPTVPRLALGLTLDAGDASVELEGHLSSVSLTVNAGSAHMLLGGTDSLGDVNATVNAGSVVLGLPAGSRSTNVSINAGSLEVCLPTGAPVRISWSGALASNDFDDQGLTKVDENTWTGPGFDPAQPHLELNVSANAGSFSLDRDGTCDA